MLDIWTDIDRQMYYLSYTWVVDLVYFWFSFSLISSGQQLQEVIFVLIIQVTPNFSFYQRPLFGYKNPSNILQIIIPVFCMCQTAHLTIQYWCSTTSQFRVSNSIRGTRMDVKKKLK